MKLSITQMVLGIFLLMAACYIVGWMIFDASSLLTSPVLDDGGVMKITKVFPEHEAFFAVARYVSGILFGLGLVVLLIGTFQVSMQGGKKLAITQIIAGVLITAISILITRLGYPTEFIVPMPVGREVHVNINPGPLMVYAMRLTRLSSILGLAVLGVSIAQLVKARR